ncbi:helix-turn-helix transcriptional regulator [Rouxiella sp. T17]|uniref:helix-turn-helix domain-containing protein n=1 Tax=Rouxiella sp. T17 TaxID=3085684 RepID=UPI002FC6407E
MTSDNIKDWVSNLSQVEKNLLMAQLKTTSSSGEGLLSSPSPRHPLELAALGKILARELKRQGLTYEEMALQIGVSVSTFKRIIANPAMARAGNLHALLAELGIQVWLER